MKSQLSYGLVCFEMQFTYFIKYMDHSYHQKLYILKNADLLSSLKLVTGDVSTLIHQMELTYVS